MNKNLPLITIIVGIYKGEKYLSECLNSIITQDYENLEIILVNDGSPDNSGKIADFYSNKDSRIKVIHQENKGVSASRNNALEISNGEYVCILDQDDIISNDYITYFYNLIENNKAEIALTPHVDKFSSKPNYNKCKEKIQIWNSEKAVSEMLFHKIVISPWNKMISRKLIMENNIRFNTNFFNGEGFAFSIECFQKANIIAVGNQKIYHYRVGDPESGASKFKKEWIESSINAQQYIKTKLEIKTKLVEKSWEFSNWHTHCDALNLMVGCKVIKENKELYDKLKVICKKNALCALYAPVSFQQKIRGILFKISPYISAKIINKFRIRKFKK